MKKFIIIGLSDSRECWFPPEVLECISNGTVFSGGKRHRKIVEHLLPANAEWIDITVPLSAVFAQYERHEEIVVFASGDPLFYGFAVTIQREMPDAEIKVYPSFNSLQTLAHRMLLPYHDMTVVSLTGRPWTKFDAALIRGCGLIGSLTDRHKTPLDIARRMTDFGYDNYLMTIGECLGNEENERISTMPVSEVVEKNFQAAFPNCVILRKTAERERVFGIPEERFALLDGRSKMITKAPIRLASLMTLNLAGSRVFWDIGFCTGSVSIEAKLQFPELEVISFEVREQCREIMAENARRFGTPGIDAHIGDFLDTDISLLSKPDAVFIGGHGGKLVEIVGKILTVMDKGRIVINAVSEKSVRLFEEAAFRFGLTKPECHRIALDEHNPINIMRIDI
ncbi:MAG: precorrin-6y C5,15-methyltransferase (decarboxylating) subunit CbiE [Bacteroides sp.]|nr:precorrin-6y C5,15-methyltransferase (decarboxylating) subunit CbiE [Roseburia sp.]MCM1346733.1 precorrin-6y C5,15-methyltransferase (decarboxylating) subunit CbiE [Bacteroides sp.]MCM1420173.1 precorrin-6y C5,15-methyltransferase (decarboxylating) subunit CbiE [Bacteroides sp.]